MGRIKETLTITWISFISVRLKNDESVNPRDSGKSVAWPGDIRRLPSILRLGMDFHDPFQ
jgi:hypothetical protein